ncbi:NAD-dependent epimerase/dehydratase family protein [Streptomyces angustmyceticus]|uniref:NAD-dependent epimerase/dehydratase family protein n=1 Tax=Streptomyces angustmyceticus TaxID=285578 RepID=UPI000A3A1848|nr:NAD-dependent epimerase/dehydratase family protein [Streptomyces angustmyceticus]UAL65470.1 NAD-dependent epimerase/dehydratase family protein [Streptomyces angustmyceticus]
MTSGSAVVIGASGQIGRAAVRALARDGWEVRAASRRGGRDDSWPAEVRPVAVDREDDAALAGLVGEGCDVLLDCVAYGTAHARQLAGLADRIGSAVVISSGAVYEDGQGRSLATGGRPGGAPQYPVPIPESQPTVAPGDDAYDTRKAALERALLAQGDRLPVTLLRAGAIHGPYSPLPRELYFVKRVLDGRRVRVLAYGGRSRFHPVHVANLAEMVRLAARRPGSRVLNAGDPEVPTVAGISAAVDAAMGAPESEVVTVAGAAPSPGVGDTPWTAPHPVVHDLAAAERELGYRAVTTYEESLPETVEWLAGRVEGRDWREVFPLMAGVYPDEMLFGYAAEDRWLADRGERG